MARALTAAAVERYRPTGRRRFIKDGANPGLYLVVQPSGSKSFLMRFRARGGKIAKISLGPLHAGREAAGAPAIGAPLTLAGARSLAAELLRQRALGADVVADHRARRRRLRAEADDRRGSTFGAAAREFVEEEARPRSRGWRATARLLGLAYPRGGGEPEVVRDGLADRWADRPVREIDAHLIFGVLDEARRVGSPGLGVRTRGISDARGRLLHVALSSLFGWLQRQRRVEANPLRSLPRPGQARARERVLTSDEIRIFWRACGEAGEPFGAIFRLLLLTGARLSEVGGMRRDELSEDGAAWSLAGARTKNKRPHLVPLSPLAREIIASAPRIEGKFIFTTNRRAPVGSWSRAKRRLDAAMLKIAGAEVAPWRLHDLRRTAVTGMAEIGVAPHVVEAAVNHVSGAKAGVAGIYNRSQLLPERRAALERWADHVLALVEGRPAKVVPIRGGKR